MVFPVLGAVAELERSLTVERVKTGLRNARAKGKRLGRPRVAVDAEQIATPRKQGRSWSEICKETSLSKGSAERSVAGLPKKGTVILLPTNHATRRPNSTHFSFAQYS
jgi:DNA invertase Pin-like site-specific DNA recombinase